MSSHQIKSLLAAPDKNASEAQTLLFLNAQFSSLAQLDSLDEKTEQARVHREDLANKVRVESYL